MPGIHEPLDIQCSRDAVPTNLRRAVYSFGMQEEGGDTEFDILWHRYVTGTSGQEKDNILYGLSQTQKLWLIQKWAQQRR